MKEKFDLLLKEYLKDKSKVVDSNKDYYREFIKKTPEYLYNYFDREKYLIKASVGRGQKCEIPWLCIFNKNVTTSATKGLYVCYLFRGDMSGFYLVLGQGITTFKKLYKKDKYNNSKKVANYFKDLIEGDRFSKEAIDLKGKTELAKGYEAGTIISKYYIKDKYSSEELIEDLLYIKNIYDEICENMGENTYMDIVENIVDQVESPLITAVEADKIIKNFLQEGKFADERVTVSLEKVDIPKYKKKRQYSEITKKAIKKTDYLKKAKSNIKNGLLGEELVLDYERKRLSELGRDDLAEKIEWVSREDDNKGYDLVSFDVKDFNTVQKKYIEVKSTEENDTTPFYISKKEIETMDSLKNQYSIYRVYGLRTLHPKVFILEYDDFKDKIKLEVQNYTAKFKI